MQRQLATGIVVLCVFNMARLRLVGRPGRRFGNKGLRYADGDRSSADRRDGRKGRLVVSVHRGLRDFVAIAGGDSDDEEDFSGFTEDEILLVIKKTSDLLALVKTSEDVAEPSVEEIGGRLRQRLQKTTAKPFLQLVKSRYMRNSFLTTMPQAAMKRQHIKNLCSQTTAETSLKPMKGSIKVRLFGKGFLLKAAQRPAWSKEKRKPREDKKPLNTTPSNSLRKEKPLKRPAPVKVLGAKTVGRSVKELLLKKKEKRLIKKSRVEVKYQLADNKGRAKDKSTEPSPKKTAARRDSLPATKMNKTFVDLKTHSKTLNKHVRRMSEYGEKHGRLEAKSLSSDPNYSQRKLVFGKRRFLRDSNSSLEPMVKIPNLRDTGFEDSIKKEGGTGGNISSTELGNLSFSHFSENKNLLVDVPKKIPMFEAPLICNSKRHRRPAQKLIMKLSEDYEMNLKRSRRSLDSTATSGELSSGDEKYDTSPKSTRNNRTGQCSAMISGDDKYQGHLVASKGNQDIGEAGLSGGKKSMLPLLPSSNSVLVQKNKDIAGGRSEGENSKGTRWRRRCCVCSGTYKLSRYVGCRVLCCRHCFRFYSSKAKLVRKGSLDLLCVSGGCCSVDWRTVSGCDACRYRKCLQYFPQPEVAISLNSAHKTDSVRQERPQSEFPLAPIAKDSLWNEELLKFLKASQVREASLGFEEEDLKATSLTSEGSLGPTASTGPSRRLCKLGKSKTATPRTSDTFRELMDHSGTSSVPDSSGVQSGSFSTVNSLTVGDKSGETETRDEVHRRKTLGAKESTRESLIKCDDRLSCPDALNSDRFSEGQVAASSAEGALQHSPWKSGGKVPEVEGVDEGAVSEGSERRGDSKGPRIKHVCRKAAVVLGKTEAVFPPRTGLCLSALPSQEKERLFQVEDNSQDSVDVDGTSRIAEDQKTNSEKLSLSSKKSSDANAKSRGRLGGPKKTMRCRNCVGCLTPECKVCTACKDMPKNGGRGTLKHACIHRVCRNPILPWHKLSPEKLAKAQLEREVVEVKRKKIPTSRLQTSSAFSRPRGRGRPRLSLVSGKKFQSKLGSISGSGHVMSSVRRLRVPKASAGVDDKFEKNPLSNKSMGSEQPLLPFTVNVDFNESTDIEDAWKRGVALYSLSSGSLRAACRLCASAGLQELIYCSVCCQPFHSFCLEERDRPKDGCDTWCCLQCQFCHVCYGQSNLLQCDKCQESYHPDCLGPNYPTKPSRRKHIWICSKCVRCRSCGATTPGHEKDATWMCDFSLCYSCGLLMEKGNFCPVCHKCYTDDDWESQMIQCFTCHSWVHSKCEELTDEMYQIVTYMPEDVPFNCRVCCPTRPSVWEILIRQEMQRGMRSVLDALVQCKSSSMLESFQGFEKFGIQETEFAVLGSNADGCVAAKRQGGEFLSDSKAMSLDEPQQINSFAKDPENGNPNACIDPCLIGSQALCHSASLLAVPVVGIADDTVEPVETLKDVTTHDAELNAVSIDGHLSAVEGKVEREINAKNITDCQTSDLRSPILGLTDAMLTASALDNVSSRPNSSSAAAAAAAADGKLRSLLQCGSKFKDYKDLHKDVPRDLTEIKAQLDKENGYMTIEAFVVDVTRIIRYNMSLKTEEANPLQVGACSSVHSLFIKQMEKCFPWFNVKNSMCLSATSQSPKNGVVDEAVHPPSMDHTYARYLEKEVLPSPPQPSLFRNTARDYGPHFGNTVKKGDAEGALSDRPEDVRCCAFCWTYGDADEEEAGRLVSAGQDDWVHVNCALWSAEVYEEINGTLQMVHAALARSRKLRCDLCGKPGATVGCCQLGCNSNFHFTCARRKNCAFLETKKVFCELHWMAVDADLIADGNFAVNRRICINPTSARWTKRQWVGGVDPSTINVLIGSLSIDSLGHLSALSDSKSALLPVDFCASRLFWSTEDPRQRCIYLCRIVEITPKAKSPEIINDITIIHDRNDPCYNVQLAKSFTAKDVTSDDSTLSAFEDDLDLSGSEEAEAFASKLQNITQEEKESLFNLSREKDVRSVNDEGLLGYPYQSVFTSRHTEWMDLEMQRQQRPLKMARSDVSDNSLPLKSSDYSQLSASTLRMLGLRSNAPNAQNASADSKDDDSDDELMLVKIASRLNEAAAKNRRQEFCKRLQEGTSSNSTEVSLSSLDAESTNETSRFGDDTGEPETVVTKNLVQMDGPPGESDLEDGGSEDLNLVADFSSEDESNRSCRDRGSLRTLSPEGSSLPLNSLSTGNEFTGSSDNCIYSSAPVDPGVRSLSADNSKKISDELLSTDCHLVNDYERTGTGEALLLPPLSSAASVQSASAVMPTMSAAESVKNSVAEDAASGVLSFQNSTEIIGDSSLRPVVTTCGVQFALSQLLSATDVSYLGSVALSATNPTRLQQVINNLQFPVDPSKAPSPLGSNQPSPGFPSVAPVSFGISNPPQIQVATPNSSITPQILRSLQQMLGTSRSSQPFFFKLRNSNPSELSSTSVVASSAFPSSISGLRGPPSLAVLPSPAVTLFNQNVVSAIPLYASSQASAGPVISGLKRHLLSNEDIDSKRIKLAGTGGLSRSAEGLVFGDSLSVESGPRGRTVPPKEGFRDLSPLDGLRGSKDLQKKSHIRSQRSSDDLLSSVLSDVNNSVGQADKRGDQRPASAINRKSKPEPMFEPHPMFRPHLPEAEIEEEIENSPLLAMLETEGQRIKDEAQTMESTPHLMFEITNSSGFSVQADSLNKAWKAVTDRVQDARLSVGMKPVSFVGVNGLYMTGLNHPAVVYLVEQLPGFKRFLNYKFKYHPPQLDEDDEVIENPRGCARAEQFSSQNKCETFSFLLSRYRSRPEYDPNTAYEENIMANKSQRRSTSLDLPMAMRFRHLRIFAKEAVGVYRSNIHGRGLFCRRDIDAGEMIIEYSGEVIRAILTDKREKHYESKAMGCYMFRKDRDHVIDSTMMGNAARFINHSCDPNCYSKVILVDNRKHIVIFAQRAIRRGEELTYDYKFPIEDVKIPCTCGSRRCRKYLN